MNGYRLSWLRSINIRDGMVRDNSSLPLSCVDCHVITYQLREVHEEGRAKILDGYVNNYKRLRSILENNCRLWTSNSLLCYLLFYFLIFTQYYKLKFFKKIYNTYLNLALGINWLENVSHHLKNSRSYVNKQHITDYTINLVKIIMQ